MTLVKTGLLTFVVTAIRIMVGLVINKAIAIYIGPSGLAFVGQFQSFSQLVMAAAQGGISSGVTKYVAEYGRDDERLPILFSTAAKISIYSSIFVGSFVSIYSNFASLHFFKSNEYGYIILIFGITIIFSVINNLLLSILNGLKEIKTWVMINIIQSLYSLMFTTLLISVLGLSGALIAMVTNQAAIFIVVLWMLRNHQIIKTSNFKNNLNKFEAKKLAGFAMMGITSGVAVPVSHLIIRDYIGVNLSWEEAGYWQAIWYISSTYLMVITTSLSIYYLPKLSEITEKALLRKELLNGYKIIIPVVIVMSAFIFLIKDFIIQLLFSEDFIPMRQLFFWQLVGDVIKISSWLIAYLMLAKAMTKTFIVTEILFNLSFVLLAILLLDKFGLVGISYAFAFNYSLYLVVICYLTKNLWMEN